MSRTPSLEEVLNTHKARLFADLRVALPARVEKYSATTQLVDVQPLVKDILETEDGEQSVQLPVITNVPVIFPGAGGMRITFPVAVGDTVLLVFTDRSIDGWLAQGGVSDPVDQRRHNITDAVAIPGLHPNTAPLSGVEAGVITLGSNTGASDFVALKAKVEAEISSLRAAYLDHGHNVATAGSAAAQTGTTGSPCAPALGLTPSPIPPLPLQVVPAVGSVGSTTVKIRG